MPATSLVITGASSGLGAGLAEAYAAPGVQLALIGRDAGRLAVVAEACRARGAGVETAVLDIRDREAIAAFITAHDQRHPVDLVIANAGVTRYLDRRQRHESAEVIRDIVETNLFGVFNTVLPLLEPMASRGGGHVAVMSSLSAWRGLPAIPIYAASKAALKVHFEGMRGRLARDNIRVSIICPGYVATPMTEQLRGFKGMVMDRGAAVAKIKAGLDRGRPLIAFPAAMRIGLWLGTLVPERLYDRILLKLFRL
jgi:short-subunit dehydrogenase